MNVIERIKALKASGALGWLPSVFVKSGSSQISTAAPVFVFE